jgi:hypothetical protein
MGDVLIRDIPEDVLRAIDARAAQLGLSRSAYLRRKLAQDAATVQTVEVDDLTRFAQTYADLGDADVMREAWD